MASQGFSASFCNKKEQLQAAMHNQWDSSCGKLAEPSMAGPRTRPRPVNPPTPPPHGPRPGPHPPVPPGNPTPPPSPRRSMWTGEGDVVRTIVLACLLDQLYPTLTTLEATAQRFVNGTQQSPYLPVVSLVSNMC
ncbi:hypothetical protein MAPG_02122 [Magnaporthiopsis poae ATCC 64411]|uniref:Uncharacterized protein n=1 Tax=Magnaporthiopsis poae (strain ATCC 64411 / 73-15) TaxID=644358 RepID=A0A0C4DQH9_MAGP6|nr:hypothetical protein MAPG_02122 [Magnaporthiopsis poae ATCC 64411]